MASEFDGAAGIGETAAGADGGVASAVLGVSRASNAVPAACAGWPDDGAAPEGSADDDTAPATTLKEDAPGAVPGFPGPVLAAFGGTGVAGFGGGTEVAAVAGAPALLEGRFGGIPSAIFFPFLIAARGTGVPGDIVSDVDPAPGVDPVPNMARTSASAICAGDTVMSRPSGVRPGAAALSEAGCTPGAVSFPCTNESGCSRKWIRFKNAAGCGAGWGADPESTLAFCAVTPTSSFTAA